MRIITAEEAKYITDENAVNNVIDRCMRCIEVASKSGHYGMTLRDEYTEEEVDCIIETLTKLGYKTSIETRPFQGNPSDEYYRITVDWND